MELHFNASLSRQARKMLGLCDEDNCFHVKTSCNKFTNYALFNNLSSYEKSRLFHDLSDKDQSFSQADLSDLIIEDLDLSCCDFFNSNLENTKFHNCDFDCRLDSLPILKNTQFVDCSDVPDHWLLKIENSKSEGKGISDMKDETMTSMEMSFSQSDIRKFAAARPTLLDFCRRSLQKLMNFLVKKYGEMKGKTPSMIKKYASVVKDLLNDYKEEAEILIGFMLGWVGANTHKAVDFLGLSDKQFVKFFKGENLRKFGIWLMESNRGEVVGQIFKRIFGWVWNMVDGEANDLLRIAMAMENPGQAPEILEDNVEIETEVVAMNSKTRKIK